MTNTMTTDTVATAATILAVSTAVKVVNLTPHAITDAVTGTTFPPSGEVARVSSTSVPVGTIMGIPVVRTTFGEVTGLPASVPGTVYLVSGMVLEAAPRWDLIAPGELVRDGAGNPKGCKGFRTK